MVISVLIRCAACFCMGGLFSVAMLTQDYVLATIIAVIYSTMVAMEMRGN